MCSSDPNCAERNPRMTVHAYPQELASFVARLWQAAADQVTPPTVPEPLPELSILETLLSTCYQASLMREEERPITFRSILYPPERLPVEGGPPTGLHRLAFAQPLAFRADELRRLSPSADFFRSLIGL